MGRIAARTYERKLGLRLRPLEIYLGPVEKCRKIFQKIRKKKNRRLLKFVYKYGMEDTLKDLKYSEKL